MKLNTYILIQYAINILRVLLYRLVMLLSLFIPVLKQRKLFESSNDESSGFKKQVLKADACFHVSSEGELQQCLTIIKEYLSREMLVELVYTSPSVERKCIELDKENRNLRSYRLPIILFPFLSFSKWVTANKLFMCRYDFYSDLMLYGAREDVEFILLSGSLKGKEEKLGSLMRQKFSLFDSIYAASDKDKELFKLLKVDCPVVSFEFRLLEIASRLEDSAKTFKSRKELIGLYNLLSSRDSSTNIVMGSAWSNEMKVFSNLSLQESIKDSSVIVCIAPHELSQESLNSFIAEIKEVNSSLDVQILSKNEKIRKGAIIINPFPGVLLESFSLFGHSYIGGGHSRSIHSVLEPFLANSMVYCGPKTHRSTEFDFIQSYGNEFVKVIEVYEDFFDNLLKLNREEENTNRDKLVQNYKVTYKEILETIIC